jgi:hypothetical protein
LGLAAADDTQSRLRVFLEKNSADLFGREPAFGQALIPSTIIAAVYYGRRGRSVNM